MASCRVTFLHPDGSEVCEPIIGQGGSGIIIEREGHACKLPKLRRYDQTINGQQISIGGVTPEPGDYDECTIMLQGIQREKAIYRRLGRHAGIVPCYDLDSPDNLIKMKKMKEDLRHYLVNHTPDRTTQLGWLIDLAHVLVHIHLHRVVVWDIRTDNILLDDDLSVKMVDFGESEMMSLDWNFEGSVDNTWSIATDLGAFGAVMYEILTGKHCQFDLFQDWTEPGDATSWPRRDSLPATDGLWLGFIIERCWCAGSLTSARQLVAMLEHEADDPSSCVRPSTTESL